MKCPEFATATIDSFQFYGIERANSYKRLRYTFFFFLLHPLPFFFKQNERAENGSVSKLATAVSSISNDVSTALGGASRAQKRFNTGGRSGAACRPLEETFLIRTRNAPSANIGSRVDDREAGEGGDSPGGALLTAMNRAGV